MAQSDIDPFMPFTGKAKQDHHRLFLSISIPEPVKNAIALAQAEFQSRLPSRCATWTKQEQLHLTLKFFGNVPLARVQALKDQLAIACANFSPLLLRAEKVGAFPDLRFPRVIWVGINEEFDQLAKVQREIEQAAHEFGEEKSNEKTFHGHATLARLKRINASERKLISELISKMGSKSFGEWVASEIHLMRSQLSSHGAQHSCVTTFQFTGTSLK